MIESVGRKLKQTRERKQITVAEAARVTRMRPDKIADLENDDFTNFPNMTYAKGFLLIYAKYLGVDVSAFADSLASTNPVGIQDYEYLNASERRQPTAAYHGERRSIMPLFMTLLVLLAAIMVLFFIVTLKRVVAPEEQVKTESTPAASPAVSVPAATPVEVRPVELAAATPEPVSVWPASTPTPTPVATPIPMEKDVTLKATKKTWVKVLKDVAGSPPVFEDWLFPDALPLKFHGAKFWIDIKDPTAVQITRDGQPVASGAKVTIE